MATGEEDRKNAVVAVVSSRCAELPLPPCVECPVCVDTSVPLPICSVSRAVPMKGTGTLSFI